LSWSVSVDPTSLPWSLDADVPPELVRRSSNEVWRAARGGQQVYLRLTPERHRTPAEVSAEVAWMAALASEGLRVVRPLPSANGRLVEDARLAGAPACVTCFTAAPGRPARKPDDYTPPVLDSWASLLADLHRHARHGAESIQENATGSAGQVPGTRGRHAWDRDRVFRTAVEAGDGRVAEARGALGQVVGWMRTLSTEAAEFGVTHADLHLGNLNVADGVVTAFDFDDACRHWFIHDVAVAVTSIRKAGWEHPGRFDAAAAEQRFVDHYFAQGALAPAWRARLEAFVAYRLALSACWASRAAETGELDDELAAWFQRSLPWWLAQLRARADEVHAAMRV
jgi:Ser/Thr protein kinase RdoA (MazF antagonist)